MGGGRNNECQLLLIETEGRFSIVKLLCEHNKTFNTVDFETHANIMHNYIIIFATFLLFIGATSSHFTIKLI